MLFYASYAYMWGVKIASHLYMNRREMITYLNEGKELLLDTGNGIKVEPLLNHFFFASFVDPKLVIRTVYHIKDLNKS